MKVALVHDWLVTAGGAEKVLWQLHLLFPEAPIYTLVYDPECGKGMFRDCDVRTTYLQKIPGATKLYKNMLTLMRGNSLICRNTIWLSAAVPAAAKV